MSKEFAIGLQVVGGVIAFTGLASVYATGSNAPWAFFLLGIFMVFIGNRHLRRRKENKRDRSNW